jgi:uncharacterized membrane protein
MTKSKNYWKRLTSTLWFLPILLAVCGVLLGLVFVGIDRTIGERLGYFPRFFGVEPSGAGNVLAIIAGSTITVVGTVYSITIVALTLASTQFSPRILRNFMRDTGNQIVLGVLVGIFAYCIVVLRTIKTDGDTGENFVPALAVVFGLLLGLLGVGFLIYFIHHVAISIQATSIVSSIAAETVIEIKTNYLVRGRQAVIDKATAEYLANAAWIKIPSAATGYIQNADASILLALAAKHDLIVKMRRRVGEFTIVDLPLLQIAGKNTALSVDENLIGKFNDAYDVDNFRTVEGDVAFGLRQIVDIALKALSPAINDSTTGVTCIDYLTAVLAELAARPSCPAFIFDENGMLRVVVNQQKFEDFFDLAFNQIRQSAGGNVAVILRLLTAIEVLSAINKKLPLAAEQTERHELFCEKTQMLEELARETIHTEKDLQNVLRVHKRVADSL